MGDHLGTPDALWESSLLTLVLFLIVLELFLPLDLSREDVVENCTILVSHDSPHMHPICVQSLSNQCLSRLNGGNSTAGDPYWSKCL